MKFARVRGIFLCCSLILLSACATTYHIPVYNNIPEKVNETDVALGLSQDEIYVKFVQANSSAAAAQFGLIGALISATVDSAINSSKSEDAENLAKPIRDAVVDVNFGNELSDAINTELSKVDWIKAQKVKITHALTQDAAKEYIAHSHGNSVLLITSNYYLSPDVKSFHIDCNVVMYPNDDSTKSIATQNDPNDDDPILYRNRLNFVYHLKSDASGQQAAINDWIKDNAVALKTAIREGIKDISRMLVMELSKPSSPQEKQSTDSDGESAPQEIVLEKGENYKIARLASGSLLATFQ